MIAENVKGLLMGNAIDYVRRIYKDFEDAGYYCQHFLLDASKMGVPQMRNRVFFVCIRHDLGVNFLKVSDLFNVEPHISMDFNEPGICYGEFADGTEPTDHGADLIAGSLIKNPGGGIASTGGYICGRADLVEKCADRLTCVGMGKEVGCSLNQNREMLLGFFLAPQVVASALKTSVFACRFFEKLGYKTLPESGETRTDIIASILLENEENLVAFCQGIQKGSPVDSYVTPEAWDMPGYDSKVIMAAGAFTMGASIELSADAPIRPPFAAWLQGGITYPTGKAGVMLAAQEMYNKGLLRI